MRQLSAYMGFCVLCACVVTSVQAKCIKDFDQMPSLKVMSEACQEKTGMEAMSVIMDGYGVLFKDSDTQVVYDEAVKIMMTAKKASTLSAPVKADIKRTVFEDKTTDVCIAQMQLGVKGIVTLTATEGCPKGLSEQISAIAGEWYVVGESGSLQGAFFDFSKPNSKQVPAMTYKTYEEEATIFWNRLCTPQMLAKYQEVCKTDLAPVIYQIICTNEEAKIDAIKGYVEEQRKQTIRDILETGFKMAVTSAVEQKTMIDESLGHVQKIMTLPNGQLEVELCPQKEELADLIISGLQRGESYKTTNGFVLELKDEIDGFLKEYIQKKQQK